MISRDLGSAPKWLVYPTFRRWSIWHIVWFMIECRIEGDDKLDAHTVRSYVRYRQSSLGLGIEPGYAEQASLIPNYYCSIPCNG